MGFQRRPRPSPSGLHRGRHPLEHSKPEGVVPVTDLACLPVGARATREANSRPSIAESRLLLDFWGGLSAAKGAPVLVRTKASPATEVHRKSNDTRKRRRLALAFNCLVWKILKVPRKQNATLTREVAENRSSGGPWEMRRGKKPSEPYG